MLHKHTITVYLLLTLGLAGYLLPWMVAPTAPMTLNAYDLAEWASLHPIQLGAPLAVPLLLRSQLPIIAVWIALPARGPLMRLLAAAGVMLLALAQLPPLEFLTISRHDSNYQQQFMLAAVSLAAGLPILACKPSRLLVLVAVGLAVTGLLSSIAGQYQAQRLYQLSWQEGLPGIGAGVLALAYIGLIVAVFTDSNWRSRPMDGYNNNEHTQSSRG